MIIERLGSKVLEMRIIASRNIGQNLIIPCIDLAPSADYTPFALKRHQFLIKLAFAMAINKSQDQTLRHVGVYLLKQVFSHGQLYVAISCATSPFGLKFLICNRVIS